MISTRTPFGGRGRHVAQYAALRLLSALGRALPLDVASALAGRVARTFGPWSGEHRQALHHIALGLGAETTPAARERIAREMWETIGRTLMETLQMRRLVNDPSRFLMPDGTATDAAGRTGTIYVGAHLGNWEVAAWPLSVIGDRALGIYRPVKNPRVDSYLQRLRQRLYPAGLAAKGAVPLIRLIAEARRGASIAMLADQREHRGVVAPFLGRPAPTTTAPALLALRLGAPLVAARAVRIGGARFRLELTPIEVERSGNLSHDLHRTTERMNAVFSGWIRETPGQWLWTHRRWGRSPVAAAGVDATPTG